MNKSFLITWNPKKWNFDGGYESFLQSVKAGSRPEIEWAVNNSSIHKGDTLYLMRLGEEPRGIIAKGVSLNDVHYARHYDAERAMNGEKTKFVTVQFLSAQDYMNDNYLEWKVLKQRFPNQMWTPQSSGIEIRDEYHKSLDDAWDNCLSKPEWKKSLEYTDIRHNIVIIKINKSYRRGMSPRELYEYTRGYWDYRIDTFQKAQYALAVVNQEVVEVYRIDKWVRASEADNYIRTYDPNKHINKIALYGEVAAEDIRTYYMDRYVGKLFKNGNAHSVSLFMKYEGDNYANRDDINAPLRPKNRLRKPDGSGEYIRQGCRQQSACRERADGNSGGFHSQFPE